MGYEKPPPTLTFYKAFFSAQCKFLIHNLVQCFSAKRTAWNEFSCSMASAVICLATVMNNNQVDDLSFDTTKYTSSALTYKVFANMRRVGKGFSGVETPLFASMMYTSSALTYKVFANMRRVGKGFSGVETPLFASMMVQPQAAEEEADVEVPTAPKEERQG
nr:hypothetical protein [Tanacetum cinerariifolium]